MFATKCHTALAEAYAKGDQKQHSIANYRKSLELEPKNQNAADKLEGVRTKVARASQPASAQGSRCGGRVSEAARSPGNCGELVTGALVHLQIGRA